MSATLTSPAAAAQTSQTQPVIGHAYGATMHTKAGKTEETQVVFQSSSGGQTLVKWSDKNTYNARLISKADEVPKFEFRYDDIVK